MATLFIYIPPNVGPFIDPDTGEVFAPGLPRFDGSDPAQLAQAERIIAAGAGFNVAAVLSALIQIPWGNVTGKPSSFTPAVHTHSASEIVSGALDPARISEAGVTQHQAALALAIAQISGLQAALDARLEQSEKGAAHGVARLDANALLDPAQLPDLGAASIGSGTFDSDRIPDLDWSKIITATRPDTLAGYGITDALTASEVGQQIQSAIEALVDGAPGALDTLNELAAALGDDPNAITALTNAVASKLDAALWQAATALVDGYMSKEDKAKLDGIEPGATADMTGAQIKAVYEGEADTNAFTDAEKAKLGGIEAQATQNASDAALRDRATHTGTQPQSSVADLEQDLADRLLRSELPFASLAHFSSTDDASDMAAGAVVQWNAALMSDGAISMGGANATDLTVAEAGRYLVSVRLVYADTSSEGADINNTLGASIAVNGASVGRQGVGSPVVNANGANEGQVTLAEPLDLAPGDVVTVTTQRLSGGDALYLIAGQSSLIIERKGGKSPALAAQTINDIQNLQNVLDDKLDTSGGAVTGELNGGPESGLVGFFMPQNPEGGHIKSPFFFNDLAFARLRGATVLVEYDGIDTGLGDGAVDRLFDTSSDFLNINTSAVSEARITITDAPKTLAFGAFMGVVFGNKNWRAKDVVLEASSDNGASWQIVKSVAEQNAEFVIGAFNYKGTGANAFRITLSNFNEARICRVTSILAYNYNSVGMQGLYLSRDGGEVYDDIFVNGDKVFHEGNFDPTLKADIAPDAAFDAVPSGVFAVDMQKTPTDAWPFHLAGGLHVNYSGSRQFQLSVGEGGELASRRGHNLESGGVGAGWSPWRLYWNDETLKPGGVTTLEADTTWDAANVPGERLVRITANSTQTLPDNLSDWSRQVIVDRGVSVVFDVGNNALLGPDGTPADLTDLANRTVTGPASFTFVTAAPNTLELWS